MNLVDLLVLAVIAVSALLGLSRGFVREMLGAAAWVLAGFEAYRLGPYTIPWAEAHIGNPDIADPLAYVGTFVALLITLSLLANLVGRLVRLSALGGVDRTLGLLFGVARGAAILIAAYIPIAQIVPPDKWPPQAQQALSVPLIYQGAVWVAARLPAQYQPRVAPPPQSQAPGQTLVPLQTPAPISPPDSPTRDSSAVHL